LVLLMEPIFLFPYLPINTPLLEIGKEH
jgi:hypothetical protein